MNLDPLRLLLTQSGTRLLFNTCDKTIITILDSLLKTLVAQNVQMGNRTNMFEVRDIVFRKNSVLCSHELHIGMANPCKI